MISVYDHYFQASLRPLVQSKPFLWEASLGRGNDSVYKWFGLPNMTKITAHAHIA